MTEGAVVGLERARLYEQVADHIQDLIVDGKVQPGDRLPSEVKLCKQFGVSRTVIREAHKALAEKGLVSIEPGRGTFVRQLTGRSLSDRFSLYFQTEACSFEDLVEAREALELRVVVAAAKRRKQEDLALLEQAMERADKSVASAEQFAKADIDFHLALARSSRNPLFLVMLRPINELLQQSIRLAFAVPGSAEIGCHQHHVIYDAVTGGDAKAAFEAMRKHMEYAMECLRVALGQESR